MSSLNHKVKKKWLLGAAYIFLSLRMGKSEDRTFLCKTVERNKKREMLKPELIFNIAENITKIKRLES